MQPEVTELITRSHLETLAKKLRLRGFEGDDDSLLELKIFLKVVLKGNDKAIEGVVNDIGLDSIGILEFTFESNRQEMYDIFLRSGSPSLYKSFLDKSHGLVFEDMHKYYMSEICRTCLPAKRPLESETTNEACGSNASDQTDKRPAKKKRVNIAQSNFVAIPVKDLLDENCSPEQFKEKINQLKKDVLQLALQTLFDLYESKKFESYERRKKLLEKNGKECTEPVPKPGSIDELKNILTKGKPNHEIFYLVKFYDDQIRTICQAYQNDGKLPQHGFPELKCICSKRLQTRPLKLGISPRLCVDGFKSHVGATGKGNMSCPLNHVTYLSYVGNMSLSGGQQFINQCFSSNRKEKDNAINTVINLTDESS
eukprot:Nk52_evm1s2429 gene=Nk52_evmTU1s2429